MEYIIIFILVIFSALFSGLTLGLMGLSAHELKRKMELGSEEAARVYNVRRRGNLLLTTLLIGNVAVNAVLSVFLGSITTGIFAVFISTGLIVIFGEIIPQAVFSRFALSLGAKVAWLVQILIWIFYPISLPISWVLNKVLGDELPTIYSKQELMKIVEEHEDDKKSDLDEDEERIIKGALTFSDKKVEDIMTPRTVVRMFKSSQEITDELMQGVRKSGLSRFPVYDNSQDNVVGILYASELIGVQASKKRVGDMTQRDVKFIKETDSLDDTLKMFLSTHKHLCIVQDEFGGLVGVLTLEDVLEEIIKSEIVDERDLHTDMRKFARENAA